MNKCNSHATDPGYTRIADNYTPFHHLSYSVDVIRMTRSGRDSSKSQAVFSLVLQSGFVI